MIILQRYIARYVVTATLLTCLVVLTLSFIIGLLGELRDTGIGDYGFYQAVVHMFFMLPHTLYQFFPVLVLLGGVIGLSLLAANQELMVMRSAGVSIAKIVSAVLLGASILIIIATLLGELIAPQAEYEADKIKSIAQNRGQAIVTTAGLWIHEANNFLHIDRLVGRYHMEGITRYRFDANHRLLASYYAKTADYDHRHWVLHDMVETTISNDKTSSQQYSLANWNLTLNPSLLSVGLVEPEEMSLNKLYAYMHYSLENHLQAANFEFEFWRRLFQPLTTLVLILLAVPFVFASPRQQSMGKRLLIAIMIGFVFYMANAFLGQISVVYQISPLLAALLPSVVFSVLAIFALRRV